MSGPEASQTVAELKQNADKHWGIDPRCSQKLAERIIKIGEINHNKRHIALGKMALGDAIKLYDRLELAWAALAESEALYREAGDWVGAASTWIGRLSMSVNLQRVDEALLNADLAYKVFEQHAENVKLIRLQINRAVVHGLLSDYAKALEIYEQLLSIIPRLDGLDKDYRPIIYSGQASVYNQLCRYQDALNTYDKARELFAEQGQTQRALISQYNRGYVLQTIGRYSEALNVFHSVQQDAKNEFTLNQLYAKRAQVECYLLMKNRQLDAYDLAAEVISGFERVGASFDVARTLGYAAIAEAAQGRLNDAAETLSKAEALFTDLNSKGWLALTYIRRGRIELERQNLTLALGYAEKSRHLAHECQAPFLEGMAQLLLGDTLMRLDQPQEAEFSASTALDIGLRLEVPFMQYHAYVIKGQVAELQKHIDLAIHSYEQARAIVGSIQQHLTISIRPGFLEELSSAFDHLMHLRLMRGDFQIALELLESNKTQISLEYLFNRERILWQRHDPTSQALLSRLDDLRDQYQALQYNNNPLTMVLDDSAEAPSSNERQTLRQLEAAIRTTTERLYLNYQEKQGYSPAMLTNLDAIQPALDQDTALIEYYCDDKSWWAFVVTRDQVAARQLDLRTDELIAFSGMLRANLHHAWAIYNSTLDVASAKLDKLCLRLRQLSYRIYRDLFKNLLGDIANYRRLIIVPYHELHFLPFNILFTGDEYLIQKYELGILPSAQLICRNLTPRTGGARVLAYAHGGLLPSIETEAAHVNRLFGGDVFRARQCSRQPAFTGTLPDFAYRGTRHLSLRPTGAIAP